MPNDDQFVACIRTSANAYAWLDAVPCADGREYFVWRDGAWVWVKDVKGFERLEKIGTKRLLYTATGKIEAA
jgi:hypothetical protein